MQMTKTEINQLINGLITDKLSSTLLPGNHSFSFPQSLVIFQSYDRLQICTDLQKELRKKTSFLYTDNIFSLNFEYLE